MSVNLGLGQLLLGVVSFGFALNKRARGDLPVDRIERRVLRMAGAMQVKRKCTSEGLGSGRSDIRAERWRGLAHPKSRVRLRGDLIANHVDIVDQDDDAIGHLFGIAAVLDAQGKRAAVGDCGKEIGRELELPVPTPGYDQLVARDFPLTVAQRTGGREHAMPKSTASLTPIPPSRS